MDTDEQTVKCELCGKELDSQRTLRIHKHQDHNLISSGIKRDSNELEDHKKSQPKIHDLTTSSPPGKVRVIELQNSQNSENNIKIEDYSNLIIQEKMAKDETENIRILLEKRIDQLEYQIENLRADYQKLKNVIEGKNPVEAEEQIKTDIKSLPEKLTKLRLKRINDEHLSQLSGFTSYYKSIPNGACLTHSAAVHIYNDENERINVKRKVNNHIADNYDNFYKNEIQMPYVETIGTGEEAHQIVLTTPVELKEFLRDPTSGSLLVYSNQQEIKALANIFNMNIHIFTYQKEACKPYWRTICPDPGLVSQAEYSPGTIPDMYLYNKYNCHFDLLISDQTVNGLNQVGQKLSSSSEYKQETSGLIESGTKENETDLESLIKNKQSGFRRTSPMSKPEETTICEVCRLNCNTNIRLKTHMKSHAQETIYDMSPLQQAIQPDSFKQDKPTGITCNKCERIFTEKYQLRKHVKDQHPSFKPCKNFPGKSPGEACTYGEQCSFYHVTLPQNTEICWDCGKLFTEKPSLMHHRKTTHKSTQYCKKIKEPGGCHRSSETCWFSHSEPDVSQSTFSSHNNAGENKLTPTNPEGPQNNADHTINPKQGFPRLPRTKLDPNI